MARPIKRLRKAVLVSWIAASLIRLLGSTLRIRFEDRAGITRGALPQPVIWLFWHNRVLITPYLYQKYFNGRRGAVLTSPSDDGEVIARVMQSFGVGSIRGSSNKRAAAALREMSRWIGAGQDLAITPDGPRGPRYHLGAGAVKLAQMTGAPLLPIHIRFENAWRLKTWDGFLVPKPFSRVRAVLASTIEVRRCRGREAMEAERQRIEAMLQAATED